MSKKLREVREVSATDLRSMFNNGEFANRLARGELGSRVLRWSHPSPSRAGQPVCTKSQLVAYTVPGGQFVAIVHQYLRPDNTLGASGKADPKWILQDGVIYTLAAKSKAKP
jgi:hypothetical protein